MKTDPPELPWCLRGGESTCPCRRHRFNPWSRRFHMLQSNEAHAPPQSLCSRARESQPLNPVRLKPRLHNEKPTRSEKGAVLHFSSVAQPCPALCEPMDSSTLASLSITNSRSLLQLMSIELVKPSNHLILSSATPLTFSLSQHQGPFHQFLPSGGQSIGASAPASVFPKNIYH